MEYAQGYDIKSMVHLSVYLNVQIIINKKKLPIRSIFIH